VLLTPKAKRGCPNPHTKHTDRPNQLLREYTLNGECGNSTTHSLTYQKDTTMKIVNWHVDTLILNVRGKLSTPT
jgi:hypothetical protein